MRPHREEIAGLAFAEAPRWHDGAFWCSDMFGHRVLSLEEGQAAVEYARLPSDNPSGLGWLPNGDLLVVGMQTRALYCAESSNDLRLYAELEADAQGMTNDMVVGPSGTAYVSDSGLPGFGQLDRRRPGQIIAVDPGGHVRVVATELEGPNGIVLSPDGSTLIVAESFASRLTAFEVFHDGALGGRRTHAELHTSSPSAEHVHPDGICIDAEGGVWLADLTERRVTRVDGGGRVTDSIEFDPLIPIACALGGPDRRRLHVCVSEHVDVTRLGKAPASSVVSVEVSIPGGGWP